MRADNSFQCRYVLGLIFGVHNAYLRRQTSAYTTPAQDEASAHAPLSARRSMNSIALTTCVHIAFGVLRAYAPATRYCRPIPQDGDTGLRLSDEDVF